MLSDMNSQQNKGGNTLPTQITQEHPKSITCSADSNFSKNYKLCQKSLIPQIAKIDQELENSDNFAMLKILYQAFKMSFDEFWKYEAQLRGMAQNDVNIRVLEYLIHEYENTQIKFEEYKAKATAYSHQNGP